MSVLLLSSAFASADVLTDLGLKPLGSYDFGGKLLLLFLGLVIEFLVILKLMFL